MDAFFVFGTHIPFQTLEYLDQLDNFTSNILDIFGNYTFVVILIIPNVLFFLFTWFYLRKNIRISNINLGITLFYLIFLGSISGVYPNSYVAKNMNDPLTSSAVNYFYWSRKVTNDEKINKPTDALQNVIDGLTGEVPQKPKYTGLPLARLHSSDSCKKGNSLDPLASALCSECIVESRTGHSFTRSEIRFVKRCSLTSQASNIMVQGATMHSL